MASALNLATWKYSVVITYHVPGYMCIFCSSSYFSISLPVRLSVCFFFFFISSWMQSIFSSSFLLPSTSTHSSTISPAHFTKWSNVVASTIWLAYQLASQPVSQSVSHIAESFASPAQPASGSNASPLGMRWIRTAFMVATLSHEYAGMLCATTDTLASIDSTVAHQPIWHAPQLKETSQTFFFLPFLSVILLERRRCVVDRVIPGPARSWRCVHGSTPGNVMHKPFTHPFKTDVSLN